MKLLMIDLFVPYNGNVVERKLRELGHEVKRVKIECKYGDGKDISAMESMEIEIKSYSPEAVFTVNFWPEAAFICHELGIYYIAWSYDCPQNIPNEDDLNYDTNYVFLYDRTEVLKYRKLGIDRVFHLPLAVDTAVFDRIGSAGKKYDISFVGRLYDSTLPGLLKDMDDFQKGFIEGVVAAQQKIVGEFLPDEIITEETLKDIRASLVKNIGRDYGLTKRKLDYSIGTYVTFLERNYLCGLLSNEFDIHVFTDSDVSKIKETLKNVHFHGRVSYEEEMPRVFKASKINLNPTLSMVKSGISLRVLDICGCGGLVLTRFGEELAEMFAGGEEIVLYGSAEEARDLAEFLLKNPDTAEKIARAGYERVKKDFTYEERIREIFEVMRTN